MHEWLSLIVCPLCTENICTVLCKACCVELTEVGIFRAVWSRLAYVVKACPNELTCTIFCVTVSEDVAYAMVGALSAGVPSSLAFAHAEAKSWRHKRLMVMVLSVLMAYLYTTLSQLSIGHLALYDPSLEN